MAGPVVGLHLSHEQHAPSALLRHARMAADAGFTAAMCSDHFHPWSARQGHAGFAWSWLGAALEATPLSFGTVCAPGQRYHPAVIAQAAATLAEMYAGRFWLAVGSGEALNEQITGAPWPGRDDRTARLKASIDVMRALWAGEEVTAGGHVRVARASTTARFSRRSSSRPRSPLKRRAGPADGRTPSSPSRRRARPCARSSTRFATAAAPASRFSCRPLWRMPAPTAKPGPPPSISGGRRR